MSDITIGTKVEGVWGAMFPNSCGIVTAIRNDEATVQWVDSDFDLQYQTVKIKDIHPQGWTSVNGSGIGIFAEEA